MPAGFNANTSLAEAVAGKPDMAALKTHPEDDDLQQRFSRILSDCGLGDKGPCRLGAAFLREHRSMLQQTACQALS